MISLLLLCGCVIKSRNEIIKNDQSVVMFKGAKNLIWITHDDQEIMLEKLNGKLDRTYLGRSLEDLSDTILVRFYKWPDSNLIPDEDVYIISGYLNEKNEQAYYYQLLTFAPATKVWTSWVYDAPDNTEIKVKNLNELKQALKKMIEDRHLKRLELVTLKPASEWDHASSIKSVK